MSLLSYEFRVFPTNLGIGVLTNNTLPVDTTDLTDTEMSLYFTSYDVKRLELYTKNMADYHLIMDLVPTFSRLYFLGRLSNLHMSPVQSALLLGLGLQHKKIDELAKEFDLPGTQLLGIFNKITKKILDVLNRVLESSIENEIPNSASEVASSLKPFGESLSEEFRKADVEMKRKQRDELQQLKQEHLKQYAIKGNETSWSSALSSLKTGSSLVSVVRPIQASSESVEPSHKKMKFNHGNKKKKGSFKK